MLLRQWLICCGTKRYVEGSYFDSLLMTFLLILIQEIRSQVEDVLAEDGGKIRSHNTIFHHLRDDPRLPAAEKSPDRLQQEGQVLVLAGSETTAKTLSIIVFHLLDKPELFEQVKSEVQTIVPANGKPTWNSLEKLPYLTAVIHEGLRLDFGITGRNQVRDPRRTAAK